ncbi:MAG: MerR family transcriptional regulator [Anaerolineae bacterium]
MPDSGAPDPQLLRPSDVADQLGISAATLRRWSSRFSAQLDLGDGGQESGSHRRYTEHDLETLASVKRLLEQGWTYEQVASQLDQNGRAAATDQWPLEDDIVAPGETPAAEAFGAPEFQNAGHLLPVESLTPAARFMRDTITGMADTQQIILNSQQASRDLMGVMIQDNLNLKGEAGSLRERMLELERDLAEQRRRQADYRERMETRVRVLEDAVARLMTGSVSAPAAPPQQPPGAAGGYPYAPQQQSPSAERRSFWSRLIGG